MFTRATIRKSKQGVQVLVNVWVATYYYDPSVGVLNQGRQPDVEGQFCNKESLLLFDWRPSLYNKAALLCARERLESEQLNPLADANTGQIVLKTAVGDFLWKDT